MITWDHQVGPSLGYRVRYPELRLGIELEFERMHDDYPVLNYWYLERDASLRNGGVEYISNPLLPENLKDALREAQESINDYDLEATWRCGGHTHLNVQYWTWKQLIQYTVLYALMEPHIFADFAPGRQTNHFCVPLWCNTALVDKIAEDSVRLRSNKALQARGMQMTTCNKYSALNFKPMRMQGTIELRHIPGTTHMEDIKRWCNFLVSSVEYAHRFDSPEAIVEEYDDNGIRNILEAVGIHTCEEDKDTLRDAYIAANMIVGHDPRRWQDLHWEIPVEQVIQEPEPEPMNAMRIHNLMREDIEELMRPHYDELDEERM